MPLLTTNGVELYYEVHGDLHGGATPLLLLAGFASDSQSWLPIVQPLAERHPLILPDNRGSGRTDSGDGEISVQAMARDCAALLEHLNVPRVHVLGHSMGGYIALELVLKLARDLALARPGLVDGLVLAATTAHCSARSRDLVEDWAAALESGMDLAQWFRYVFQWIFTKGLLGNPAMLEAAVRFAVEYPYPQSPAHTRAQTEAIKAFDRRAALPVLQARTLILCGAEDILFPLEESRELEAIPGARTEVIPGAAHSIHMEQPQAFVRSVLGFLGQDEPGQALTHR